jgi:tryprostatin B 6-hydroxylase
VGKRVAMVVLRFTVAYTVMHYEFEFAPGEDGKACIDEAIDAGTITAGKLYCTFRRREV